jgi:hypothetical protein
VTARPGPKDALDVAMMKGWIRQSYRAAAPKKLAALVEGA